MKPQLFLLHFAGGSIYSFQFIRPYLADFEFIPLELPGRGKRAKEGLIRDFDQAVGDICGQIGRRLQPGPFLIYGHSMGAIMALHAAGMLERTGSPPRMIVVSGNPAPAGRDDKKRYLMERDTFKAEIEEIGGVPDEVLHNEELLGYYEPLLKADFEVLEKRPYPQIPPVNIPIHAIMGTGEERVDEIGNWRDFTNASFEYTLMEGKHFFIHDHPEAVARIIKLKFF